MSSNSRWSRVVGVIVLLAMVLAACGPAATPTEEAAPPTEAPPTEIPPTVVPPEEKVTITWATIAGFYTDWAEEVAKEFEAKTGYDVDIIDIDFSQLYEKQVIEMVGGTGAYDLVTYDVGWKAEFANSGYLIPLDDYIAASDPNEIQFDDLDPALVEATSRWKGNVWGLAYYTFTMGYFYRCDLFEDPGEMAAFEAKYGYPLDVPQTYEQLADIAEFFRREPGDTLKGETVAEDFYGIGLMAGRFPHVQDEFMSIAWTKGEKLIKDDGTPGTTEPGFLEAAHLYVDELLPYAPPGALTSAYDEVVGQMRQGLIAQTAAFYLDQWPNMVKTEDEVPGAEICAATSPGAHTWVGALGIGLSADSKHPDEAWEFLRWITGPEAQRKFAEGGGSTIRRSILEDKEFLKDRRLAAGHFPPLVEVLDHAAECNFYPNYYYVPQGGKIYDEETTWFSSAASGEYSVEEAMQKLAEAITQHCGGPCEIPNDHLGADYSPVPCPYTFDKSVQMRKEAAAPPEEAPPAEEVTVTWATIAGFYTDWAKAVAEQYEEETGVNVDIVEIDFSQMYEKQVIEMVGDTGAYDIVCYDVGWKAEWANSGYILALDDYIAASDPEEIQFDDLHPALIETATRWKGQVWGLPYYTFTMGYFYRCDLFEDPGEMAAFEAKYGYPLGYPQTYEQLADIAEFFRRKPGETLKGEVLDSDFYGIGLMAGRFPHVQDEVMAIEWTHGNQLILDDGTPGTTEPGFLEWANFYVDELLPYAPPGALTSAYDEVVGQMRQGLIAQTATFYLDQWPNMVKTEDEVPGSEICAGPAPGAHTWVGALTMAINADSKHPDEAWDFLKWMAGPEAQRKFAEGGGSTCRISILTDEEFLEGRRLAVGHFPPLMEVLDHASECNFYPNYYYVPQGGKIYDEETTWFSSATSGEYSVEEAMQKLADAITQHCGGPCEIPNDNLGADYHPSPCPYTYDPSIQMRK